MPRSRISQKTLSAFYNGEFYIDNTVKEVMEKFISLINTAVGGRSCFRAVSADWTADSNACYDIRCQCPGS